MSQAPERLLPLLGQYFFYRNALGGQRHQESSIVPHERPHGCWDPNALDGPQAGLLHNCSLNSLACPDQRPQIALGFWHRIEFYDTMAIAPLVFSTEERNTTVNAR